ncbi:MAG: 5-oxoprolinase subunit PxpB [Saprospiraceae bacterium]|nr:5-oxoprolinase subunit PxpB [Saprospiraceae bacterium]
MNTFKPFGDQALLINFEQKIDSSINDSVIELVSKIQKASIIGITFLTPAYCSLTVGFDPNQTNFKALCQEILSLQKEKTSNLGSNDITNFNIPVCYTPPYSIDFQAIIHQTSLSESEIIKLHTTTLFKVYMIGFLPGFPYLGTVPNALFCHRKKMPRLRVPAQSVALAGLQSGIYPSEAPGGWQIIGRTPIPIFNPKSESPFLLKAGDQVRFQTISEQSYLNLEKDIHSNNFEFKTLIENG